MRNLNIKSDEAYELAHFVAQRTGRSVTATITDLLRREKRALTKDELIDKWTRTSSEIGARLTPEQRAWNPDADLYDADGLPR